MVLLYRVSENDRIEPPLTGAVRGGPTPAAILLASPRAVAHESPGPSAGVVDRGPVCEQLPGEDGVGRDPRVPARYRLRKKIKQVSK